MASDNRTALQILGDALVETVERAHKAERERDAAKKDAENWYNAYMDMKHRAEKSDKRIKELSKHSKELEDELAAAIAGNETLCKALGNAAQMNCPADCPGTKKGEQNNG